MWYRRLLGTLRVREPGPSGDAERFERFLGVFGPKFIQVVLLNEFCTFLVGQFVHRFEVVAHCR